MKIMLSSAVGLRQQPEGTPEHDARLPCICWTACRHCVRSWLEEKAWKTTK